MPRRKTKREGPRKAFLRAGPKRFSSRKSDAGVQPRCPLQRTEGRLNPGKDNRLFGHQTGTILREHKAGEEEARVGANLGSEVRHVQAPGPRNAWRFLQAKRSLSFFYEENF